MRATRACPDPLHLPVESDSNDSGSEISFKVYNWLRGILASRSPLNSKGGRPMTIAAKRYREYDEDAGTLEPSRIALIFLVSVLGCAVLYFGMLFLISWPS